jgi:hypothetical protein
MVVNLHCRYFLLVNKLFWMVGPLSYDQVWNDTSPTDQKLAWHIFWLPSTVAQGYKRRRLAVTHQFRNELTKDRDTL